MNDREKIVRLLSRVPERKLGYVLAYVQGITADADEPAPETGTETAGAAELALELALAAETEATGTAELPLEPEPTAVGTADPPFEPESTASAVLTADEAFCMRAYRKYLDDPEHGEFIPLEQALKACRVSPNEL